MTTTPYLDKPPNGWFPLEVMRRHINNRSWDWVALMVDEHPAKGPRKAQAGWLLIPGKHRNRDAAWDALESMLATRH